MCDICNKEHRPLNIIAHEIRRKWLPKVNYAAEPYLAAMLSMTCVKAHYYMDDGASIVRYFLANASTFRGADARRLKAELKAML